MRFRDRSVMEIVVIKNLHNCNIFSYQLLVTDFLLNKHGLKHIIIINFSVNNNK